MSAHDMTQEFLRAAYASALKVGLGSVRWMSIDEIKTAWPEFTGPFERWLNLCSPEAGWASKCMSKIIKYKLNFYHTTIQVPSGQALSPFYIGCPGQRCQIRLG